MAHHFSMKDATPHISLDQIKRIHGWLEKTANLNELTRYGVETACVDALLAESKSGSLDILFVRRRDRESRYEAPAEHASTFYSTSMKDLAGTKARESASHFIVLDHSASLELKNASEDMDGPESDGAEMSEKDRKLLPIILDLIGVYNANIYQVKKRMLAGKPASEPRRSEQPNPSSALHSARL